MMILITQLVGIILLSPVLAMVWTVVILGCNEEPVKDNEATSTWFFLTILCMLAGIGIRLLTVKSF